MDNLLYYKSQNAHIRAYENEIKQQELNTQYQIAQNKIIREGERNLLTSAQIMQQLSDLYNDLIASKKEIGKIIPFSKTAALEIKQQEDKYKPLTASEYENIIKAKKYPSFKQRMMENSFNKSLDEYSKQKDIISDTEVKNFLNKLDNKIKSKKKEKIIKNQSANKIKFAIKNYNAKKIDISSSQADTTSTSLGSPSRLSSLSNMSIGERNKVSKKVLEDLKSKNIPNPFGNIFSLTNDQLAKAYDLLK